MSKDKRSLGFEEIRFLSSRYVLEKQRRDVKGTCEDDAPGQLGPWVWLAVADVELVA